MTDKTMNWSRSKNTDDELFLGQPVYTWGDWEIRSEGEFSSWSISGRSKGVGSVKTTYNIYENGSDIMCPCPTLKEAKEFVNFRITRAAIRAERATA